MIAASRPSFSHGFRMRRFLPSTMSLLAFEASARHMSFTEAAKELCLTQGAISRQIRLLEQNVGCELFHRGQNRISLTEAGGELLGGVREGLDTIDRAMNRLRAGRPLNGVVDLAAGPTIGARWLMPRFPSFAACHPDIVVNLSSRITNVDLSIEPFDAAIHICPPDAQPAGADWLMDEGLTPVCSPAFRETLRDTQPLESQLANRLLHLSSRLTAWAECLAATGLDPQIAAAGPRFEQTMVLIEAIRAGIGIGLIPRFVAHDEIERGFLVSPFSFKNQPRWAYWLVCGAARASSPSLQTLREWILSEAELLRDRMGAS